MCVVYVYGIFISFFLLELHHTLHSPSGSQPTDEPTNELPSPHHPQTIFSYINNIKPYKTKIVFHISIFFLFK